MWSARSSHLVVKEEPEDEDNPSTMSNDINQVQHPKDPLEDIEITVKEEELDFEEIAIKEEFIDV